MNMSQVLHRRHHSATDFRSRPSAPSSTPPSSNPPDDWGESRSPWPVSAKVAVAILIVATVLGALGTVIASSSGNDSAERELEAQVDALTGERDEALRDLSSIDAELATARQQLLDAQDGNDDLSLDIADLETRIGNLTTERTELVATVAALEGDVSALDGRADMLEAALNITNDELAAAISARDNLASLFPLDVGSSLRNADLVGQHAVKSTLIYSSGSSLARAFNKLTITRNDAGHLGLSVPGLVEGGLFTADDALHMVTSSTTALPAVGGVARRAEVTITLFPASYRVAADGKESVSGVSGVMTVFAQATGSASEAVAFYAFDVD